MKFIIKLEDNIGGTRLVDYIGTGTYVVNGEKYAVLVGTDRQDAKRYSSRARAERSLQILSEHCSNVFLSNYTIEEVEE